MRLSALAVLAYSILVLSNCTVIGYSVGSAHDRSTDAMASIQPSKVSRGDKIFVTSTSYERYSGVAEFNRHEQRELGIREAGSDSVRVIKYGNIEDIQKKRFEHFGAIKGAAIGAGFDALGMLANYYITTAVLAGVFASTAGRD